MEDHITILGSVFKKQFRCKSLYTHAVFIYPKKPNMFIGV